jgi:hypothetical protein
LAFALMHETGHHLAGAPRHPFYSSLSSEDRADEWSITTGLPMLFGATAAKRYAARGQAQLAAIWSKYSAKSLNEQQEGYTS